MWSIIDFKISPELVEISIIVKGDTVYYQIDYIVKVGFRNQSDTFILKFIGQYSESIQTKSRISRNEFKLDFKRKGKQFVKTNKL